MADESSTEELVKRINKTITKIKKEMPSLAIILSTYGKVFSEKVRLREELPFIMDVPVSPPDPLRFSHGMTLLNEGIFPLSTDSMEKVRDRMIPVLSRAFPKIRPVLRKLKAALKKNQLDLKTCMESMLHNRDEIISQTASRLETDPFTLKFILGQLLKPLIERQAENLRSLIENLGWQKGYCPVCGSFPVLSYLKGDEGQRWLICGLCGHKWRFMRTQCPFCENEDPKKSELCFVEDRAYERAEMCHQCKRYLTGIDLRKYPYEFIPEVALTGMMYLDVLAQGKGFIPMADPAWTLVPHLDISSKKPKSKAGNS
ncbi:MAG: formate dehydrogenase accessory protein FdhE [Kiritimatiellae bacterium]|nr:formate dehydrogenase accessory protein FdhE [Kiritimatiellia bacterium]